jgi:hypothetical protein
MAKHKRILQRALLVVGLVLFVVFSASLAFAQNVPEGYQSDETLQKGMIVRLKKGDGTKVEAITQKEAADMLGVVVSLNDSPVALTRPGVDQEVFVAITGRYDVLVSSQNGPIETGDYVTVSSLRGVGMKANSAQQLVVGKALKPFSGKNGDVEGRTVIKTNFGERNVALGRVPIEVTVAHNPLYEKQEESGVPDFLSKVAEVVTDRPVSALRIYAGLAILVISLFIAGGVLYAGIRSGMIAIGRNPLAKRSITKGIVQTALLSLIVFVIGIIAVYLLLRI